MSKQKQHAPEFKAKVEQGRYDRCPVVFLSAIAIAVTVLFWV